MRENTDWNEKKRNYKKILKKNQIYNLRVNTSVDGEEAGVVAHTGKTYLQIIYSNHRN